MTNQSITIYGTAWCGDCHRAKRILGQQQVPYTWIDVDAEPAAEALMLRLNGGVRSVPTIVFPDGSLLVEPSSRELLAKLDEVRGLSDLSASETGHDRASTRNDLPRTNAGEPSSVTATILRWLGRSRST